MAPGANAVGLIDDQQPNIEGMQPPKAVDPIKLLGGQEQNANFAGRGLGNRALVLVGLLIAVDGAGKILGAEINPSSHAKVLDDLVSQI